MSLLEQSIYTSGSKLFEIRHQKLNNANQTLLFVLNGPGGVNGLSPVINALISGYHISVLTFGKATDIFISNPFKMKFASVIDSPTINTRPCLAFVEFSALNVNEVAMEKLKEFKKKDIPVILFEDYPNKAKDLQLLTEVQIPDYIFAFSPKSREMIIRSNEKIKPERVIVTGNPSFDHLSKYKKENKTEDFFNILWAISPDINEEELIQFSNSILEAEKNTGRKIHLTLSVHPRHDINEIKKWIQPYSKKLNYEVISNTPDYSRNQSDLEVAFGESTELLKAAYCGIPSLCIKKIRQDCYKDGEFYPIDHGGSIGIEFSELTTTFVDLIQNNEKLSDISKQLQKKFRIDGHSKNRIIQIIQGLIN